MPVNNRRSYSNSSSSNSGRGGSNRGNSNNSGRGNGGSRTPARSGRGGSFKAKAKDAFNMLNLLTAFGDIVEWDGNEPSRIKVRALLKTKDGNFINPQDEQGNEYDMEEAVQLLAAALLSGKGINFYLFLNENGDYGGNGRIDIKDIEVEFPEEVVEEPAPAPKRQAKAGATKQAQKKTSPSKARDYEADIRNQVTEEDEDNEEEILDEDLPL